MLSLLAAALLAVAPPSPALKAFRAGDFEKACPLFAQVVKANRFDAWGWNDVALCEIKRGGWLAAAQALDQVSALLKAVADEKLESAAQFNRGLLSKAIAALKGDALQAALQALTDGGVDMAPVLGHMPPVVMSKVELPPQAPEWLSRCVELDRSAMKKCHRRWLLCTTSTQSEYRSESHGIVIDGTSLARWHEAPVATADANATIDIEESDHGGRCGQHDEKGNDLGPFGSPDDSRKTWSMVQVDVCGGFLIQTRTTHRQCASEDQVEWFKQGIVPLTP